ncbi:MAG: hypothetical protein AABW88_01295, partial [Nanoarchaeota archaeon]
MKDRLQIISLFMAFLVVTLPIASVQAFAFTTYAVGSKHVNGYRAETDTTTIIANISESGVKASDVKLITNQNKPFSQCTFSLGTSICKYDFASGKWAEGEWAYQVSYNGQGAQNSIIVDKIDPVVTINSIVQQGKLMIAYSVSESAFRSCSGINRIEFTLGGTLINTTKLNFNPGTNCDYTSSAGIAAPSTNNKEKDLCLNVFDNVGNKGTSCQKVIVDKELGEILDLQIVDSNGNPIYYIAAATAVPINAKIRFKIKEHDLDKITVDASEFATQENYRNNQKNIDADCYTISNNEYLCEIPVVLDLLSEGSPSLKIHIKDKAGNEDNRQKNILIKVDNKHPAVKSFSAGLCGNRNVIGPANNSITAAIEEADSGLNGRKVYLDLSSVLGGGTHIYPNECKKAGINWICRWGTFDRNETVTLNHGMVLNIRFVSPSQDDAGNSLESGTDYSVKYYDEQPSMTKFKITADSAEIFRNEISNYPTVGGTLTLTINVSSDLPVTASADFSQISSSVGKYNVQCTGDAIQKCLFKEIGPLRGPFEAGQMSVPVTLKDCAGNTRVVEIPIEVSQIESTTSDYCVYPSVSSGGMPSRVDRAILRILPQSVFFETKVSCAAEQIISQKITKCDGESSYLEPDAISGQNLPSLIGVPSSSFYTRFNLRRATSPPNSVTYTCTIMTIVKNGVSISHPEPDAVPFVLAFYDSLGSADQTLKAKVDDIKNSDLVQMKWLDTLNKWLSRAQSVCGLYSTLQGIAGSIGTAGNVLQVVAKTLPTLQPTAIGLTKASTGLSNLASGGVLLGKFCDFMSCRWIP